MESSLQNVNCCQKILHIDDLLSQYQNERMTIMNLLTTQPTILVDQMWSILSRDLKCVCNDMNNVDQRLKCGQCSSLDRVVEIRTCNNEKIFLISCGKEAGKRFHIVHSTITHVNLKLSGGLVGGGLGSGIGEMLDGELNKRITGDPFSIVILITWSIENQLLKSNIPVPVHLRTAYICKQTGSLMYDSDLTDIVNIETAQIKSVAVQILAIFTALSAISFCLGDYRKIGYTNTPCSYQYDGYYINGAMTIGFHPLFNTSIVVNNLTLSPTNDFRPKTNLILQNRFYQYIDADYIKEPMYAMTTSLAWYGFMLTMMVNNKGIVLDPIIKQIWLQMWIPTDLIIVEERISKGKNHDIYSLMSGLWINADIIAIAWHIVRTS